VSTVAAAGRRQRRANLYAVVSAAWVPGRHYHGVASTLAYQFLSDAIEDPTAALSNRLRAGDQLPASSSIYQHRDPRAELMFDLLRDEP
jgi:citrate synthase